MTCHTLSPPRRGRLRPSSTRSQWSNEPVGPRASAASRATGDPRSRGQVMADTFVGRVRADGTNQSGVPAVTVGLVMPATTFFGLDDGTADVEGYEPIPGALARELVTSATEKHEVTWPDRVRHQRCPVDPASRRALPYAVVRRPHPPHRPRRRQTGRGQGSPRLVSATEAGSRRPHRRDHHPNRPPRPEPSACTHGSAMGPARPRRVDTDRLSGQTV